MTRATARARPLISRTAKLAIAAQSIISDDNVETFAARYGVHPTLLVSWRKQFRLELRRAQDNLLRLKNDPAEAVSS